MEGKNERNEYKYLGKFFVESIKAHGLEQKHLSKEFVFFSVDASDFSPTCIYKYCTEHHIY